MFLMVLVVGSSPAAAQVCGSCAVKLREEIRLGAREGPGALGRYDAVVRTDSRGRYFVTWSNASSVLVFAPEGRYLRTLGREGDGPGEFRRAFGIVLGRGDSLHVFDNGTNRLTVFDPELRIARMHNVVHSPGSKLIALEDGHFVAALDIRTPERAGLPLHVFDAEGILVRSFGSTDRDFGPGFQQSPSRTLAAGANGLVWSAHIYRYEIIGWDTTNRIRARVRRNVAWFAPREDTPTRGRLTGPLPAIQKVWEARDGLLWVAISVADPDWRNAIHPDSRPGAIQVMSQFDYRDTVIEMLDRSGRLRGYARVDGLVTGFLPGDRIVVAMEDADGYPYLSILRPINPP